MTQREMTPPRPLPNCPSTHKPRYMYDALRLESKGGHFIRCRCSATPKCANFYLAWAHWHKMHGTHPAPAVRTICTVLPQLQLRLVGNAHRWTCKETD